MASTNIPVNVNITSAVEGTRDIKKLTDDLKRLQAQGAKQIKDPTGRLRGGVTKLNGAFSGLARGITVLEGPLNGLSGRFNAVAGALTSANVAFVAIGTAIATLGIVLAKSITAGADYESQMLRLQGIIDATGGSAGRTAEEIDDLARSIDKGTLASAAGVRDAAGVLLSFKSVTGDIFDRTLVVAQDLAEVMRTDIRSAALVLGKAMENPRVGLTALTRAGVVFTETQKDQIIEAVEFGRVMEANDLIIAQVEKRVGGTGALAASGLKGKMDELTFSWTTFLEEAGTTPAVMAPVLGTLRTLIAMIDTLKATVSGPDLVAGLKEFKRQLEDNIERLERRGDPSRQPEIENLKSELDSVDRQLAAFEETAEIQRKARADRSAAAGAAADERGRIEAAALLAKKNAKLRATALVKEIASSKAAAIQRAHAELSIQKEGFRQQSVALDRALEDQLISIQAFATQRTEIQTAAIDAETAAIEKRIAAETRAAAKGTEAQRIRSRGVVAGLEAQLIVLNNKRSDVEVKNARDAAEAEKDLAEALTAVRRELAQITGTETAEQRRKAIEEEFDDLIKKLTAENSPAAKAGLVTAKQLINAKAAEGEFAKVEEVLNRNLRRIREEELTITTQQAAGLLTQVQARERLVELQKRVADEIGRALPDLEAAAAALGPDAQEQVARWRGELERALIVVDEVALRLQGEFQDALTGLFDNVSSGAQSAKEAFTDFARSVVSSIRRILAEKLAEKLLGSLSSGGGGGAGGIFGAFSKLFTKGFASGIPPTPDIAPGVLFSEGGPVTGPGTGTSDSIPARLSAGEYVLRSAAVQKVGVGLLNAINGMRGGGALAGGALSFRGGGLVPPMVADAAGSGVRIVNVIDPRLAEDYLTSSSGERTVLNIIQRNRGSVKQVLS